MKRNVVKAVVLCGLIGALAVGGTTAYLTDWGDATNTFTVGKVDIDLKEPNWKPEEHDKIQPSEEMKKDPTVENIGVNSAYTYIEVSIPIKNVTTVQPDGTRNAKENTEMFSFTADKSWTKLSNKQVGSDMVYLYTYNQALAAGAKTTPLFQTITMANIIEGELDLAQLNVGVRAYGIQELNTDDNGASFTQKATAAWNKYATQNKDQAGAGQSLTGKI